MDIKADISNRPLRADSVAKVGGFGRVVLPAVPSKSSSICEA
jgi:hypothetical protein